MIIIDHQDDSEKTIANAAVKTPAKEPKENPITDTADTAASNEQINKTAAKEQSEQSEFENDPAFLTKLAQKNIVKPDNNYDFDIILTDFKILTQQNTKWLKDYEDQDQQRTKDYDSISDYLLCRNYEERQDFKRFLHLRNRKVVLPVLNFKNYRYVLAVITPRKHHLAYLYPLNQATLRYTLNKMKHLVPAVKNWTAWQEYLEKLITECCPITKQDLTYDLAQFEQLDRASYGSLGIYKFNASGYVCHDTALQSDDHWREIGY